MRECHRRSSSLCLSTGILRRALSLSTKDSKQSIKARPFTTGNGLAYRDAADLVLLAEVPLRRNGVIGHVAPALDLLAQGIPQFLVKGCRFQ